MDVSCQAKIEIESRIIYEVQDDKEDPKTHDQRVAHAELHSSILHLCHHLSNTEASAAPAHAACGVTCAAFLIRLKLPFVIRVRKALGSFWVSGFQAGFLVASKNVNADTAEMDP